MFCVRRAALNGDLLGEPRVYCAELWDGRERAMLDIMAWHPETFPPTMRLDKFAYRGKKPWVGSWVTERWGVVPWDTFVRDFVPCNKHGMVLREPTEYRGRELSASELEQAADYIVAKVSRRTGGRVRELAKRWLRWKFAKPGDMVECDDPREFDGTGENHD